MHHLFQNKSSFRHFCCTPADIIRGSPGSFGGGLHLFGVCADMFGGTAGIIGGGTDIFVVVLIYL